MIHCHPRRRLAFSLFATAACVASTGCEALSPQQLWKLNRQPNLERGDAYFSIPAEVDAARSEGDVVTDLEAPDRKSAAASPNTSSVQG